LTNKKNSVSYYSDKLEKKWKALKNRFITYQIIKKMNITKTNFVLAAIFFIFTFSSLLALEMKKVIILDFINIEKKPNFQYLEVSITDAVREGMIKKFVFQEIDRSKWEEVADLNFLYKDDYYTKSVATNLGLLAQQDIIISGGFKIISTDDAKNVEYKKDKDLPIIATQVRILNIATKKPVAEFIEEGPADNRIFESVNKIVERINEEAKAVLPSREEWEKKGLKDEVEKAPFFENFNLGFRAGPVLALYGVAKRINLEQPAFFIAAKTNLSRFHNSFALQFETGIFKHSPVKEKNVSIDHYDVTSSNYVFSGYTGWDLIYFKFLGLHPQIGGGIVWQLTNFNGEIQTTNSIIIPFAAGGSEVSFKLNPFLSVILGARCMAEIEKPGITYINTATGGINFKW